MPAYQTRDRVAIVRPVTIPAPDNLLAALDSILDDDGVWCLLVDATAPLEVDAAWNAGAAQRARLWRKPAVIALNGDIYGPALHFANAFDVRVASPSSSLDGQPALESLRGGAVFAVAEDPFEEAQRIATVIASRAPYATQLAKEAIWRGSQMPLEQALRFETDLTLLLQTTKDRAEGVAAFIEKRTPNFTGS